MRASFLGSCAVSLLCLTVGLGAAPPAAARPSGPAAFCATYPESPHCTGHIPSCTLCHDGPPLLNAYGNAVAAVLWETPGYTDLSAYDEWIEAAMLGVEGSDADGDGLSNLEEITLGLWPANAQSHYVPRAAPSGPANPAYDVGAYDPRFALRRVHTLYCGAPPSYEEMEAFRAADDPMVALQDALHACLGSAYWRNEGVQRLADPKIRPLEAVGFDGLIPLADYSWDYRLFSHVLTDHRDARDLLRARYHIDEQGRVVEGIIPGIQNSVFSPGGQPLPPERRAGMLTTQWFLVIHTMFSALPRTTAAQAYRAYLGVDIAKGEGILPVPDEPLDVDHKGVDQPTCAVCHSTIDPLSYAFAAYEGIGGLDAPSAFARSGTYNPTRTPWGSESVVLGEAVSDVVGWAEVAASSELFSRSLALMFWRHALGREPAPDEQADFLAIWRALPEDGYSANRLIERIVKSRAFGVP